jgi:aminopeptidase N
VGEYTEEVLGVTDAGTTISVWYLPGGESAALAGTATLVAGFDWYEKTLGPYVFGDAAGAVEVRWGPGAYGGMEHHPFWHVSNLAMAEEYVQLHEAAHGWFGDGIRIACWEDFVLSEGTVTYLGTRALGVTAGPAREAALWAEHSTTLDDAIARGDHVAWPDSCGEVDILTELYTSIPYMKGAFFYRAVAAEIGAETLDGILATFFETYAGQSAGMQDMLDMIQAESGFDPTDLASGWLRSLGRPDA